MDFRTELIDWVNRHGLDNRSNTPDYILAEYVLDCIRAFDKAVAKRDEHKNEPLAKNAPENSESLFGVAMQQPNLQTMSNQPIPAEVGNKVTKGWSNPFGGTSWGA